MTTDDITLNHPTHQQIAAVNLATVPLMTTDRHIPRKEQAALARELFRRLGIKGISVTAPNYSMAQSVHIRVPEEKCTPEDFIFEGADYQSATFSMMPEEIGCRQKHRRTEHARELLESILAAAFPNHDDRSDSQSDYFDYKWSLR